jgi:hypothetical protein
LNTHLTTRLEEKTYWFVCLEVRCLAATRVDCASRYYRLAIDRLGAKMLMCLLYLCDY